MAIPDVVLINVLNTNLLTLMGNVMSVKLVLYQISKEDHALYQILGVEKGKFTLLMEGDARNVLHSQELKKITLYVLEMIVSLKSSFMLKMESVNPAQMD